MEANPDIYGLAPNALEDLQALADSSHISEMIDWQQVKEALERKEGIARDVTMRVATPILSMSSISTILSLASRAFRQRRLGIVRCGRLSGEEAFECAPIFAHSCEHSPCDLLAPC